MALSAFDLLGSVVTTLYSAYAGRFDRLTVDDASTGLGVSLQAHPHPLAQGGVHPLPGSIQTPGAEVVVDALPGWVLVREQSPGTAAADEVENGVEDLAGAMQPGSSGGFGNGQVRFEAAPFGVLEVALVCFSHARNPTE